MSRILNFQLPFGAAVSEVNGALLSSGFSAEQVDSYSAASPEGRQVWIGVYEKYYMRASNRTSMTAVVEDLGGFTRVYLCGSGGGQGVLFSFDWGAGNSFENKVADVLARFC